MNKTFKTIIDEDGFVRLPIRIHGPNGKTIKLIGIVDTASSYVIIPPFACQLLNLAAFNKQKPETSVLTGSGFIKAPMKKAAQIEIVDSQIRKREVAVLCHPIPRGISILGYSFLKNCKATFNWKRKTFTLEEQ